MANCFFRRAIVSEDIFEILESIKVISNVVSEFHDYKLIIKTHPEIM